jgi:hypothetical protein
MAKTPEKQSTSIKPNGAPGGKREGAGRKRGVPNKVTLELGEAAREYTPQALKTLVNVCQKGQSESARVAAACALLDRGYGRPKQALEHAGKDGSAIQLGVQARVDQFLEKIDAIARRQKEHADNFEPEESKSRGW